MKLHELVENKIYIGEDGREYEILDNSLCQVGGHGYFVTTLSTLTQNFTPKKVKRTAEVVVWLNIYPNDYTCNHRTKEEADENALGSRIACVEVRGTYEVEE